MDLNGLAAILLLFLNAAYAPDTTPISPEPGPRHEEKAQPSPREIEKEREDDYRVLSFYIWSGVGVGLVTGTPITHMDVDVGKGVGGSAPHAMPEVGITWFDIIETTAFWKTYNVPGDIGTFGGRLKYWRESSGAARHGLNIGFGKGYVYHVVNIESDDEFEIEDKTKEGGFHASFGYEFCTGITKNFDFLVRLDAVGYFPIFSANIEFNVGLVVGL